MVNLKDITLALVYDFGSRKRTARVSGPLTARTNELVFELVCQGVPVKSFCAVSLTQAKRIAREVAEAHERSHWVHCLRFDGHLAEDEWSTTQLGSILDKVVEKVKLA